MFNMLRNIERIEKATPGMRLYFENSQCKPGEPWICCELPAIPTTTTTPAPTTTLELTTTPETTTITEPTTTTHSLIIDLPSAPDCGIDSGNKLYGGEETRIDEFPWLVRTVKSLREDRE